MCANHEMLFPWLEPKNNHVSMGAMEGQGTSFDNPNFKRWLRHMSLVKIILCMTQIIVWGINDIVVGCLEEVEYQVAQGDKLEDQDIKNVDARNDEGLPNHEDSNAMNSQDSKNIYYILNVDK